jgi:DtxR family Mn-dependent transcriptional regulator
MGYFVMADHNLSEEVMSESIEMYLLRMALLQQDEQPVPIPQLAQELSISPVSAHEMCRKLTDRGLVQYEPYKGVRLTTQGEALAQRVLRCRRLWEVFFVEKLGIEPQEAEEIACRFEHVTPEELADRLANFLGNPLVSPQNAPIPYGSHAWVKHPTRLLTSLAVGGRGQVVGITADEATKEFLRHQGMFPGVVVEVLAVAEDGSLLLDVSGQHLSLSQMLANSVDVT